MAKRKPAKAKRRKPARARQPRRDPLAEFGAAIGQDGHAQSLTLADDVLSKVKTWISTGSLALDRLMAGKGVPCGRVTEMYGPNHIGKSTLLDHMFAECQRMGGYGILLDIEGARDEAYTQSIGVDISRLSVLEFDRAHLVMEEVVDKIFDSIDFWYREFPDVPIVIGWDALGSTRTRDEANKSMGEDPIVAAAASVMRRACRAIMPHVGGTNIALVVCNHSYTQVQTSGGVQRQVTYAGEALRHAATFRLKLRSAYPNQWIKSTDGIILGRQIIINVEKNRFGNPWNEARVALMSGHGIDNVWSVYEELKARGFITTSGSWSAINLDGEVLKFQGWNGLNAKIADDETLFPRLVSVYQQLEA